jgi:PIN domain nuclease of toxin-antitoxin system
VLLDTHAVIWALEDPARLGSQAAITLRDKSNLILVSAVTIWELAIKVGLGKLTLNQPYRPWIERAINDLAATVLPITVEYSAAQSSLPLHHRDPFDRMLVAQALVEQIPIVSSDPTFDRYGISRVW